MLRLLFFCLIVSGPVFANSQSKLPIPRFVTIKSGEANMRTGPNVRYPIIWVYVHKNEPLEIIAEFEHWRKVKDKNGDVGWIHEANLSGKRYGVIKGKQNVKIQDQPTDNARTLFEAESELRVQLLECKSHWCKIEYQNLTGWLKKTYIWGVYENEEFD